MGHGRKDDDDNDQDFVPTPQVQAPAPRWRRSLPWILRTDAFVPAVVALFGCTAFQHRYLVPLCACASYVINGHGGVSSPAWASAFLSSGTALAYASAWFLGRKNTGGDKYLLGEYHKDTFQLHHEEVALKKKEQVTSAEQMGLALK